jgi:uncharacterized protein with ParB-like and HNH nuclease domain
MANMTIDRKNISKLFSDMQGKKFIIPDYQRPYKWDIEKCETLWNDVVENSEHPDDDYFLGTIVTYKNAEERVGNLEVIDGQQRITSFFLLLRAFYKKLEDMAESKEVIGLKRQIEPCLWNIDKISQEVNDKTEIHIKSRVATENDNETFHSILRNGILAENAKDNYSKNYAFFVKKCDEYAANEPLRWYDLIVFILNNCVLLPIECDKQDTALTIFSTLNDRGMPLSDADIFKAKLYRHCGNDEDRHIFTQQWTELSEICESAKLSIDDIFRYYMFVIKGENSDKEKEVALRRFYNSDDNLYRSSLMEDVTNLAKFWESVNTGGGDYVIDFEAKKYIQCLVAYPNEYWKYPVSVFFIKNRTTSDFNTRLNKLMASLTALMLSKFIFNPSVNAIRPDVLAYNAHIYNETQSVPDVGFFKETDIRSKMEVMGLSRISKSLLLLDAYLNPSQTILLPDFMEVEHIFPKKWQDTNYNNWNEEDAQAYLEKLGNKVVFEKRLNIQAGNGYFGRKKEKYAESKVANVKLLASLAQKDWNQTDIEKRDAEIISKIIAFFTRFLRRFAFLFIWEI